MDTTEEGLPPLYTWEMKQSDKMPSWLSEILIVHDKNALELTRIQQM
jgi:hypothetical protein